MVLSTIKDRNSQRLVQKTTHSHIAGMASEIWQMSLRSPRSRGGAHQVLNYYGFESRLAV